MDRSAANAPRYRAGDAGGHYESWFIRANHPTEPRALWVRYTIFSPKGRPAEAVGELWGIAFDGDAPRAAKTEYAIQDCTFGAEPLHVALADAVLQDGAARGQLKGDSTLRWDLRWEAVEPPLLLLDRKLYDGGFPKAKALVPAPALALCGWFEVDGERWDLENWPGTQNHNWGVRHTDHYAWGQVARFDNHGNATLECSTARVRVGPLWTPFLTPIVLRIDGETIALNTISRSLRTRGRFSEADLSWTFSGERAGTKIRGKMSAPAERWIALPYNNPPGGVKTCLNSKLARCELSVERPGHPCLDLVSTHGAAFEILTDHAVNETPVKATLRT